MDLAGMLLNGAEAIRNPSDEPVINRSVAFSLETIARHVEEVRNGQTTLTEFCEVYGLQRQRVELARRCILAGTSAKGCCPGCGAPWARVVERVVPDDPGRSNSSKLKNAVGLPSFATRAAQRRLGQAYQDQLDANPPRTTGWRPTCSCAPASSIPCRVLDPFLGSGRTALACEELGRDCVGIELNPASVQMAKAQLERAKARRFIGDAERVPVAPGQLRLF